jgi:hypothetical protein
MRVPLIFGLPPMTSGLRSMKSRQLVTSSCYRLVSVDVRESADAPMKSYHDSGACSLGLASPPVCLSGSGAIYERQVMKTLGNESRL